MNEENNEFYEKETDYKKIVIPAIVAVVTMIALTVGATYAYFQVNVSSSVTNSTVNATTAPISSVALSGGNKTISMNITAANMVKGGADKTFYAPATGSTPVETASNIVVGTATQTGAGNNSCTYTITITPSVYTLYTAFSTMEGKAANQIVLTVGDQTFDFNDNDFGQPITKTGNITTNGEKAYDITANFKFVNSNTINQNDLAGKTETFTIGLSGLSCTATS